MLTHMSSRERLLYFAAALMCLGIFGFVGAQYLKRPSEIVFRPLDAGADSEKANDGEVVVHVVGAVMKPGLFKLSANSRVNDALQLAGGKTKDADLEEINLAARLIDGTQVRIPRKGTNQIETLAQAYKGGSEVYASRQSMDVEPVRRAASLGAGGVSLNTATQAQLESLPQIGPATARKILDYRKSTGGFSSVEELLKVNGIGSKKLAAIRKFVRL